MGTQKIETTFQIKRGKAASWEKLNPVLSAGEPSIATDTGIFKIGDGVTTWKNLPTTKIRRDNSYNYSAEYIPANSEICLVDTPSSGLRVKVGDGVTAFGALDYSDTIIIMGYYADGQFYSDAQKTVVIDPLTNKFYIDLASTKLYVYDGSSYIAAFLGLKALAYKDNAATTVTDYATGIKGASYTPSGAVEVESTVVATAMTSTGSFTPAGDVSGSMTPAGTVTIARDDSGVTITGSVTAPKITITPNTTEVQHISSVGTLASYTPASYKAPSVNEAKSAFATAGLVAEIDDTDKEMLVFSAASTSNALTATGFNAGSYTAATYTPGTLPVLGEVESVMTGIASATATAPTFNGDKFAATFAGTEGNISATFTGTADAVSVSGNYDKTTVGDATFTGTAATIAPTLETGSKTITVQ